MSCICFAYTTPAYQKLIKMLQLAVPPLANHVGTTDMNSRALVSTNLLASFHVSPDTPLFHIPQLSLSLIASSHYSSQQGALRWSLQTVAEPSMGKYSHLY